MFFGASSSTTARALTVRTSQQPSHDWYLYVSGVYLDSFDQLVDNRIRQIIQVAKQQGQSLEATLQTLDRFYREGLMGDLEQDAQAREQVLGAWRRRLESLWQK
jgi:hypothetical protein